MNVQLSSRPTSLPGHKSKTNNQHRGLNFPFSARRVLLVLVDAMLVIVALSGAFMLWQRTSGLAVNLADFSARWYVFIATPVVWWTLAWLNDLYDIPSSTNKFLNVERIVITSTLILALFLVVSLLASHVLPRLVVAYYLLITLPTFTLWRLTYASLFSAPPLLNRVLIVGKGNRARTIIRKLREEKMAKYQIVGYIDVGEGATFDMLDEVPKLGCVKELPVLAQQHNIHEVVIAVERELDSDLLQVLIDCQAQGISILPMVDLYLRLYRSIPIQHIHRGWALHAMQAMRVSDPLQGGLKRLMDLVLGTIGLLALALVLPPVALAIRLDSPGPISYRQTRSGRAGQPFSIIKFRTMRSDAERDGQARWAAKDDDRITPVGRFLRKTRLDELPQVLNVLRGDMSIIGPRPERPEFIEKLQQTIPFYNIRLIVKPGLTGWAQIHYGYGNTMEDALTKLEYDFYYLRYWSLWLDLYIVFRTIGVVFKLQGI